MIAILLNLRNGIDFVVSKKNDNNNSDFKTQ